MKYLMLSALLFLFVQIVRAQDTIVKRNGDRVIAKVTEVDPAEIKYKRFDIPDGPVYVLPKEQIKFVIYANGTKESFEDYVPEKINVAPLLDLTISPSGWKYFYKDRRITEPDMLAVANKLGDKKINLAVKKTEQIKFIQDITLVGGALVFIAGYYLYRTNAPVRSRRGRPSTTTASQQKRMNGEYMMLGGLTCEFVSIGFRFNRKKHAHLVMDAYNKTIDK